ncbi:MAG: DUF4440 domain-containing protein [Armatimonadota bacterium]
MFILTALVITQSMEVIQKEIDHEYLRWDKAVVGHDEKTMESMLAKDFSAIVVGREKPMTKSEFAGSIESRWKNPLPTELRFVTKIYKVELVKTENPQSALYAATIQETVNFLMKYGSVREISFKSYDTWRKSGKSWQIIISKNLD